MNILAMKYDPSEAYLTFYLNFTFYFTQHATSPGENSRQTLQCDSFGVYVCNGSNSVTARSIFLSSLK